MEFYLVLYEEATSHSRTKAAIEFSSELERCLPGFTRERDCYDHPCLRRSLIREYSRPPCIFALDEFYTAEALVCARSCDPRESIHVSAFIARALSIRGDDHQSLDGSLIGYLFLCSPIHQFSLFFYCNTPFLSSMHRYSTT